MVQKSQEFSLIVITLAATKNPSTTGPSSLDYIFKSLIEESGSEEWLFLD